MVYAFFGAMGVVFVFCCSGMHLPMWNAKGRLSAHMMRDLNLPLPANAKVTDAVSVASRDPEEYYAIALPSAEVGAFMAKVRSASRKPEDLNPARSWYMGRAPSWWPPTGWANGSGFQALHHDELGGWTWLYSESAGVLYVFWFRT